MSGELEFLATAIAGIIVLSGFVVSSRRLRGLERSAHVLSQASRRLAAGDVGARVRLEGSDDLADVAQRMNEVGAELARLKAAAEDARRAREEGGRLRHLEDSNWIATVAHELRTPLTSVRMAIHLCLEEAAGPLTERQRELLAAGREDGERLQATVDELLDLSRIQAGGLHLERTRVSAQELAADVRDAHERLALSRGVRLSVEVLPDCAPAHADRERAALALTNLVGNAIRHTPEGGRVVITAAREGEMVRFEVADEGEGIPAEYQTRVFDRFFRIPGRPGGASGLGLAIARDVVIAHGGTIGVESAAGRGSRFWFTLPVAAES
jgi:two-component system, NtrC family, sensor histidine kinase KinB